MGSHNSKTAVRQDDQSRTVIRKQIGKRSSINFLQGADARALIIESPSPPKPSDSVAHVSPVKDSPRPLSSHPIDNGQGFPHIIVDTISEEQPSNVEIVSNAQLVVPWNDGNADEHVMSPDSIDAISIPSSKKTGHDDDQVDPERSLIMIAVVPHLIEETPNDLHASESSKESIDGPETPLTAALDTPMAPVLRVLTPLADDSPTRYGFDEAMENVRVAVTREMEKKKANTGPELFRQALDLQKSSDYRNMPVQPQEIATLPKSSKTQANPGKIYRPKRKNISPGEILSRSRKKHHLHVMTPNKISDARITRLLRRPWPNNLTRDEVTPGQNVHYALAQPLTRSQRFCPRRHTVWQESCSLLHSVECGICLCASDCKTDSANSWTCEYCLLRVCSECKAVFDKEGIRALMNRYADGSKTAEAKKAKAHRKSMAV